MSSVVLFLRYQDHCLDADFTRKGSFMNSKEKSAPKIYNNPINRMLLGQVQPKSKPNPIRTRLPPNPIFVFGTTVNLKSLQVAIPF